MSCSIKVRVIGGLLGDTMEVLKQQAVIDRHLSSVEAMIDYYQHAFKEGAPSFRGAGAVLEILMKECRNSLYDAMEASEKIKETRPVVRAESLPA